MPEANQGQQQPTGATQGAAGAQGQQTTAGQGQQAQGQAAPEQQQQAQAQPTFEEWLAKQDEPTKGLITERFKSLEATVRATRTERDDLAKQVREAAKGLEEGSAARKALEEVSGKLEETERRTSFYEEALKPEISCTQPRLAYMAAMADGLIDGRGRINWETLKTNYPDLFRRTVQIPPGNAGNGAGQQNVPAQRDMNAFIRRAAGR